MMVELHGTFPFIILSSFVKHLRETLFSNNPIKQNMGRGLKLPLEEMHVVLAS